ncbi:MAG: T9SS type A sorting domain-containing protein [Bacteroidia bacterium]|nr:T9SS type A sorting domain-containing protein [Bacteroidia bacterium]
MKKFILNLLPLVFLVQLAFAQNFDKKINLSQGSKTCALLSSGTRIVGFTNTTPYGSKLVAINPNGDTLWTKEHGYYNGTAIDIVRRGPNDQILVVGLTGYSGTYPSYYPFIAILDSSGNILNYKHFQSSSVTQTTRNYDAWFAADGTIFWTGWYKDIFSGGVSYYEWHVPLIAKFNSNLTLAWSRQYGNHNDSNRKKGYAYEMELAPDGNPVVWGTYDRYSTPGKYFLTKINKTTGSVIWAKDWPFVYTYNPTGLAIAPNGDIFAVQESNEASLGTCIKVHKFSDAGTHIWSKDLGSTSSNTFAQFATISSSGELLITGFAGVNLAYEVLLIKSNTDLTNPTGYRYSGSASAYTGMEMVEDASGKLFLSMKNNTEGQILQIANNGNSQCGSSPLAMTALTDATVAPVTGTTTTSSIAGLSFITQNPTAAKLTYTDTVYCYFGPACQVTAHDSLNGSSTICPTDSVELIASGGTLFQWMMNGMNIPGANSASYYASATGFYQAIVGDGSCSDTSAGISIVSQPVTPTWADFVGTSQSGDTLFEITSSNGWGSKAAASAQVLQPNQEGGLAHVVHENKGVYYIGLSWDNPSDPSQLTIDHAFYVNKSQLRVREAIGTDLVVGSVAPGDTLQIVRVGSSLNWLKNGSVVYTKAVDNSKSLRADASLFKKDSYLTNVWLTFCSTSLPLSVSGSVEHNDCANGPMGSINLAVSGGTPPFNYSWSNGASTANNTSLEGGTYSVTVTDNAGGTAMASFVVLNRISWTDQVGAAGSVDTLSRTLPNSSWGTSGARSVQVLGANADGYFMHLVNRLDRFYVIGLSDQNTDESQTTIDYAFYNSKGTLRIKEESGFDGSFGAISLGDTLKIERVGSTIKYWQNSTLIRSTSTNPTWSLMVDASLYSKGTVIYDIYSSFCTDSIAPDSFYASIVSVQAEDCFLSNGAAEVTGNGGIPPYSYLWSSAETTAAISGKAPGLYTCTVSDQNGMNQVISVEILSKIVWEGFIGSAANGDTLYNSNSSNGWGTSGARSDNKALNGSDGKVVHVVNSVSKNYYIGLSDSDPDASQFTIDYAFYNNKGNLYIREEKTGFFQNYGTVAAGDTLVVERRISSMYWYQNGNLLRSIGISPTETLRVDVSMFSVGTEIYDTWVDFCDTVPGQKSDQSENGSSLAAHGSELILFPNPTSGLLTLEAGNELIGQKGEIISLPGRTILTFNFTENQLQLDCSLLPAGMYLVRVGNQTLRFIRE